MNRCKIGNKGLKPSIREIFAKTNVYSGNIWRGVNSSVRTGCLKIPASIRLT